MFFTFFNFLFANKNFESKLKLEQKTKGITKL